MFKSWRKTIFFNFLKYLYFQFLGLKSYFSIFNIKLLYLGNLKSLLYISLKIFSLKNMSDLLICSFLGSTLSDMLMVAHFWWATLANPSWSLIFGQQPERFAHIPHFWWGAWAILSHRSPTKREWGNKKKYIKHSKK